MVINHMAGKMLIKGVAAYIKNQINSSVQLFTQALEHDSKLELGYVSRGAAYLKLEKFKEAMADFNQVIKLNPKYARAYHLRGLTYEKTGDIAKAYEDYDRALEIDPGYGAAYHSRDSLLSKNRESNYSFEELEIMNYLMSICPLQIEGKKNPKM